MLCSTRGGTAQGTGGVKEERDKTHTDATTTKIRSSGNTACNTKHRASRPARPPSYNHLRSRAIGRARNLPCPRRPISRPGHAYPSWHPGYLCTSPGLRHRVSRRWICCRHTPCPCCARHRSACCSSRRRSLTAFRAAGVLRVASGSF